MRPTQIDLFVTNQGNARDLAREYLAGGAPAPFIEAFDSIWGRKQRLEDPRFWLDVLTHAQQDPAFKAHVAAHGPLGYSQGLSYTLRVLQRLGDQHEPRDTHSS